MRGFVTAVIRFEGNLSAPCHSFNIKSFVNRLHRPFAESVLLFVRMHKRGAHCGVQYGLHYGAPLFRTKTSDVKQSNKNRYHCTMNCRPATPCSITFGLTGIPSGFCSTSNSGVYESTSSSLFHNGIVNAPQNSSAFNEEPPSQPAYNFVLEENLKETSSTKL